MTSENSFQVTMNAVTWQREHLILRLEAWGIDGARVRATPLPDIQELPGALLPNPASSQAQIESRAEQVVLTNGKLRAELAADGGISFFHAASGALLLRTPSKLFHSPPNPRFAPRASQSFHLTARFEAQPGERFYGLGQHQHGLLDQKGCVIELEERNTSVCIPFLLSSRGYGFLWNNPAVGRVELAQNETRWVAEATAQMDFYIAAGDDPPEILQRYAEATGHPSAFPEWAAGFWQCKLRYRTQDELLRVAREYKRRGLPLDIIVVDYFHWSMMGEWKFDPEYWPNPAAMVRELDEIGVKVMVSVWPTVNPNSANYTRMLRDGLLVRTEQGIQGHMFIGDAFPKGPSPISYYDSTNPQARLFIWKRVKENYYAIGIKVWWLDACEPEIYPMDPHNLRYHLGNGLEVGHLYPLMHAQAFYEGMTSAGEQAPISLCRSAWAGSQRYGAAVWSGDIPSTFEYLRKQVPAGLNIALSGIPWWTTDIGGFMGGDLSSEYFRELIVRWFQYGLFCPLFRLHGVRQPFTDDGRGSGSGADNEVWSFGEKAYQIISQLLFLRERLKPYILRQMQVASERGLPPMRPLFVDYPDDETCWEIEDQFLFGSDLLVAPVLYEGQLSRKIYLPPGGEWLEAWDGRPVSAGWLEVETPLERIPVFWRKGSEFTFMFSEVHGK
jgi:alpha-D-xyloside xylohydrolase